MVCYRFKEKYLRAMDQVAAAATTKETTQQKLGEDNLGNKMLQVKMFNRLLLPFPHLNLPLDLNPERSVVDPDR